MKETGKNDILLIIPAYNEAGNIERVVDEIEKYPELDYVVVTDGSTDGTDEICRRRGYHAIHLSVNLGLAGCFQTGMKYAAGKGYAYAVQFDGDGQHKLSCIRPMAEKMREGFDIVMGSRFLGVSENGSRMNGMRGLGSLLIRGAIRLTSGTRITDPTCGLRMYGKDMIREFAYSLNYAPEPDTISYLIKNGARVTEIPVTVEERLSGQSYLRPMKAIEYMVRMLLSILIIQNFRKRRQPGGGSR